MTSEQTSLTVPPRASTPYQRLLSSRTLVSSLEDYLCSIPVSCAPGGRDRRHPWRSERWIVAEAWGERSLTLRVLKARISPFRLYLTQIGFRFRSYFRCRCNVWDQCDYLPSRIGIQPSTKGRQPRQTTSPSGPLSTQHRLHTTG